MAGLNLYVISFELKRFMFVTLRMASRNLRANQALKRKQERLH